MTTKTTAGFALMVQPETQYDTKYIRAYVVIPQEDGELHNPRWARFDDPASPGRFEGFRISAYVGYSFAAGADDNPGEIWGSGYSFTDVTIEDADHATAIAKIMRQLAAGLAKIQDAEGYADDLHALITRIARVLKIKDIYLRNGLRAHDMSGERYRKGNGYALQLWINHVSDLAEERKFAEALGR